MMGALSAATISPNTLAQTPQTTAADLMRADLAGGPLGAAKTAAQLLARAFSVPET